MNPDIVRIPAINSIVVENFGVICHAHLEFDRSLTLILCPGWRGVTTLVSALAAAAGADVPVEYLHPDQDPVIQVAWTDGQSGVRGNAVSTLSLDDSAPPEFDMEHSLGEKVLLVTERALKETAEDQCLIVEKEVTRMLDLFKQQSFMDLILAYRNQLILFLDSSLACAAERISASGCTYRMMADGEFKRVRSRTVNPMVTR